jgi:hypothetical protein
MNRLYGLALLVAMFCGRRVPILPGVTVAAWIPALVILGAAVAALGCLTTHYVRQFRSAPYPRTVPHWSACKPGSAHTEPGWA